MKTGGNSCRLFSIVERWAKEVMMIKVEFHDSTMPNEIFTVTIHGEPFGGFVYRDEQGGWDADWDNEIPENRNEIEKMVVREWEARLEQLADRLFN